MGGALILVSIIVTTLLWGDLTQPLRVGRAAGDARLRRRRLGRRLAQGRLPQSEGTLGAREVLLAIADRPRRRDLSRVLGLGARQRAVHAAHLRRGWQAASPSSLSPKADLIVPFFKTVSYPLGVWGFIALTYCVIVGTSNAVNLTDGLDGLAIMPTVMVGAALGIFAYVDRPSAIFSTLPVLPAHSRRGRARRSSAARSRARAWASCGSTRIRPTCSWATSARWRSARALGTIAVIVAAGDRAVHHGRRVRRRDAVGDRAGRVVQADRQARLPDGAASIITTS